MQGRGRTGLQPSPEQSWLVPPEAPDEVSGEPRTA